MATKRRDIIDCYGNESIKRHQFNMAPRNEIVVYADGIYKGKSREREILY